MAYDVAALNADLEVLRAQGARVFDIGYTQLGRPIPCVFKGNTEGAQVLVQASMHAREFITTPLVIEMMKNYNSSVGMWCVPMVNIDGVMLCQYGLDSVDDAGLREFLLRVNGGSTDFSLWKANIRAVDLNVNWNANWGTGVQNVTYPSPGNYIGEYPVSESENIALRDLTNRIQPDFTLSYHTKGEVIFKGFGCLDPYPELMQLIGDTTSYPVLPSGDSAGGYKDWFVTTTAKPGLTIEVVSPEYDYPIPFSALDEAYAQNADVLRIAAEIAQRIAAGGES